MKTSQKSRRVSSVLLPSMPLEDRAALLAYYEVQCWERDTGSVEARAVARAMHRGEAVDIPETYWTHVCCQCGRRGAVLVRASSPIPIDWTCQSCGQFVCHHCTLTVPGSVPRRFREQTLCSILCWQRIGSPREEEELPGTQDAERNRRAAAEGSEG